MTIYHRAEINCCPSNPLIAFQSTVTFDGTDYYSYLRDYQGNIRCVVRPAGRTDFEMVQQNHYYPYGLPASCSTSPDANPYKYGSKHLDTRLIDVVALLRKDRLNLYDFEARLRAPALARFLSPDPHASDYHDLSPYIFCAANPIRNIDPTGMDWYETFSYKISLENDEPTLYIYRQMVYTEISSQKDFENAQQNGEVPQNATYLGKIAVICDGSYNERLGNDGTIDGEGAINASVTVYGPNGKNDIQKYTGYTMSSDFEKYGAIADGRYNVNYDELGMSSAYKSHYAINNRDFVPCVNGVNPNPGADSPTHKNGIFIHRTNWDGKADGIVSFGCILIKGSEWIRFENQIGKNGFTFILNRKR